jgi:hypothetical protein
MSGYGDDVVRCEWSVKDMKRKRKSVWSNIGFSQMPKEFRRPHHSIVTSAVCQAHKLKCIGVP